MTNMPIPKLDELNEILDWYALYISTHGKSGKNHEDTKQAIRESLLAMLPEKEPLVAIMPVGKNYHEDAYIAGYTAAIEEIRSEIKGGK